MIRPRVVLDGRCAVSITSTSASTSSQPLALAFRVQRCSSGTDTISLPQEVYLTSPSQLLTVFVQLSSSGIGTVPLPPAVYLGSTSYIASRFPCPAIQRQRHYFHCLSTSSGTVTTNGYYRQVASLAV